VTWLSQLVTAFSKPLKWWVTIAPWERGLRVRLGKTAVVLEPGIRLRIPLLDRIFVQSVRLRTIVETGLTATTRDGHALTYTMALSFCIADIRMLYDAAATPEASIRAMACQLAARFVVRADRKDLSPAGLAADVTDAMAGQAEALGLGGCTVAIMSFTFARALRILMNDYRDVTGLHNFETDGSGLK